VYSFTVIHGVSGKSNKSELSQGPKNAQAILGSYKERERIAAMGPRTFIGGGTDEAWHHIGKMQYHYLVSSGLRAHHKFLDVACGCLRLGQWLIPMLDEGNYYGLDGSEELISHGIEDEMLYNVISTKKPNFATNYNFNLDFIDYFDFAIAQSLLTHLTLRDIELFFKKVKKKMKAGSKLYCTFFEGQGFDADDSSSDSNLNWWYKFETLQNSAEKQGLTLAYIGDWGHPQPHQKLFLATLPTEPS
jgi:SAM-dependent methyltransferase